MLTPEDKSLKEKCESEIADLGKERKRISREYTENTKAGEEFPKLPPRWDQISKEMERCHVILAKLSMKVRGDESVHTTAEGINIKVTHSLRMVQIRGFPGWQINPHLRAIEYRQDELGILDIQPCRDRRILREMDRTGRICRMITLKDYEGLNKYLAFLGV